MQIFLYIVLLSDAPQQKIAQKLKPMKLRVSTIIPSSDYVNSTLINSKRGKAMSYQENSFHIL